MKREAYECRVVAVTRKRVARDGERSTCTCAYICHNFPPVTHEPQFLLTPTSHARPTYTLSSNYHLMP
jgi:hypothetical protein